MYSGSKKTKVFALNYALKGCKNGLKLLN